jgi:streptogramin lyase
MSVIRGLRRALPVTIASVLALAIGPNALASPLGQVAEFPTPTAGSAPEGIVAGPNGNLWFAEFNASKIGELNPATGAITEFATPTANSGPLGVGLGPDGSIWFTEFFADRVGEVNPATGVITEFALPNPNSGPVAIVAGSNGNLWFTESAANKIAEINPATRAITEFPVPPGGVQPFGIAAGPDGNVWFTEKDDPTGTPGANSRIGLINPTTGATSDFPTPTPSSAPNAIAAGPDGSLWFTEQAANKVVSLDPGTKAMHEVATPTAGPVVIAPGPDGNMWFTEGAPPTPGQIAVINPVTDAITEFPTTTAGSGPVGITTGSDGNLWFTEVAVGKIGSIGAGAPAPSVTGPAVTGTPQPGNALNCQGETWSSWAGLQPSLTLFGFDGFQWLRDGGAVAGASTGTYTVAAGDVGHQISCRTTATYPLLGATVSALSPAVTVSPTLAAALTGLSASGTRASLTFSCIGLPSQICTGPLSLTSRVTSQGTKTIAIAAKAKPKPKPKPKPKITKTVTVATGSYSVAAGRQVTVTIGLNSAGRRLLTDRYTVPAAIAVGGTTPTSRIATFSYGRLHISPTYTWAFGKSFSEAQELTLTKLPARSKVAVICTGHGCPFAKRSFTPKNGKVALAPALAHRHLSAHAAIEIEITAPNDVGQVIIFTVRSAKPPAVSARCLPPGTRTPSACA